MVTSRPRVGILATHPIQYQVPWYQSLAASEEIDLIVFYGMVPGPIEQGVGFGWPFTWDIPMFEGYVGKTLTSARRSPTLHGFFGNRIAAMAASLESESLDALIVTGWNSYPLLQGLSAARRLGIPCIVRGESNSLRRRPAWVRALHRALLRRYAAALAIGKLNRQFYRSNGVPEHRIFSSPYFIDNDRFRRQMEGVASRRRELRRRWGIPPESVCFLFAGKLQTKKRPEDLFSALEISRGVRDRDVFLLVVGAGELAPMLQRRARERRLPVAFAGFLNQSEITEAYAAADCLVLPSDEGETWGLVVNEAMACGLPAIVSDRVGCRPDLIDDGVTGWSFRCGDASDLALRLANAAASPARLRTMGERARERVLEGYTVDEAVRGVLEAVRSIVGTVARRSRPEDRSARRLLPAARRETR